MANKFNARKVEYKGEKFDSKLECERFKILEVQEEQGLIKDLERQPVFILQDKFRYEGKAIIRIKYTADFRYEKVDTGETVIEEVKGYKTESYKIRYKLFIKKFVVDKDNVVFREITRKNLKEIV